MGLKDRFDRLLTGGLPDPVEAPTGKRQAGTAEEPLIAFKNSLTRERLAIYADRVEQTELCGTKKSVSTIPIDQIAQVRESRGLVFAELTVESTGGGTIALGQLSKTNAAEVKRLIERLRTRVRDRTPLQVSHPPRTVNFAEQITMLSQLHEQGLLTDDEFDSKKHQLLDRL